MNTRFYFSLTETFLISQECFLPSVVINLRKNEKKSELILKFNCTKIIFRSPPITASGQVSHFCNTVLCSASNFYNLLEKTNF